MMSELGGLLIGGLMVILAVAWDRIRQRKKRHDEQLKRNADAHDRARRVNDEMDGRTSADVADWLRKRAGR